MERKASIYNLVHEESESLSNAWERFKLLLRKYLNHIMSAIEQMTHFIDSLRIQKRMLRNASTRGKLRVKTYKESKTLIENMCQNEYRSSERVVKQKGFRAVDQNTTLAAQIQYFPTSQVQHNKLKQMLAKFRHVVVIFMEESMQMATIQQRLIVQEFLC